MIIETSDPHMNTALPPASTPSRGFGGARRARDNFVTNLYPNRKTIPPQLFVAMAVLLLVSIGVSNHSLMYLSYPVKVVIKSSKLLPVMLLGLVVQGRTYHLQEYICALMLIVGLVFFTLGNKAFDIFHLRSLHNMLTSLWSTLFDFDSSTVSSDGVEFAFTTMAAAAATRAAATTAATAAARVAHSTTLLGVLMSFASLSADSVLNNLQEAMRHSYNCYRAFAWGFDELQPLSKTGKNWFGMGLHIVDSLGTLHLMGMKDEFAEAQRWIAHHLSFTHGRGASFFETNIRAVGGLLSGFALTGDEMFVRKCRELADIMFTYFNPKNGFPPSSFSVRPGNTNAATRGRVVLAEIGTLQMEWLYLAVASKNATYAEPALKIFKVLDELPVPAGWPARGLIQNDLDVANPQLRPGTISWGAAGDSYYEYLLKVWLQTGKKYNRLRRMYSESARGAVEHMVFTSPPPHSLTYISTLNGNRPTHVMEHLACFTAGTLAHGAKHIAELSSHMDAAKGIAAGCYDMYERSPTRLSPESVRYVSPDQTNPTTPWNIHQGYYILRPEAVESFFFLFRLTGDEVWRERGWQVFLAIEERARLETGYSGLRDIRSTQPQYDNTMQTFLSAETFKYLWLLFAEPEAFDTDKWLFNTEAHLLPVLDGDDPIVKQVMADFIE